MAETIYPVHMYKHLNHPKLAHDRKLVQALELDGWTGEYRNIPPQEFPQVLYRADGVSRKIGDYEKDGTINEAKAIADRDALLKDGWQLKAIVIPEGDPEPPPAGSLHGALLEHNQHRKRIDTIEESVATLCADMEKNEARLERVEGGIEQILTLLTKPKDEGEK